MPPPPVRTLRALPWPELPLLRLRVAILEGLRGAFGAMGAMASSCWKGVSHARVPPTQTLVPFQERNQQQGIPQPQISWAYQEIRAGERRQTFTGVGEGRAFEWRAPSQRSQRRRGGSRCRRARRRRWRRLGSTGTLWRTTGPDFPFLDFPFLFPGVHSSPFPSQVGRHTYKADLHTFQQWNAVESLQEWYFPIRRSLSPPPPSTWHSPSSMPSLIPFPLPRRQIVMTPNW